jgi:hypothetical protein
MLTLTDLLPPRSTTRQATAFFMAAAKITAGQSVTLTELLASSADSDDGQPILGTGAERILVPFCQPTKRDPEAVGWLDMAEDEDDRRRKLLKLTPRGAAVVEAVSAIIRGEVG